MASPSPHTLPQNGSFSPTPGVVLRGHPVTRACLGAGNGPKWPRVLAGTMTAAGASGASPGCRRYPAGPRHHSMSVPHSARGCVHPLAPPHRPVGGLTRFPPPSPDGFVQVLAGRAPPLPPQRQWSLPFSRAVFNPSRPPLCKVPRVAPPHAASAPLSVPTPRPSVLMVPSTLPPVRGPMVYPLLPPQKWSLPPHTAPPSPCLPRPFTLRHSFLQLAIG